MKGLRERTERVRTWTQRHPWSMLYISTIMSISLLIQGVWR